MTGRRLGCGPKPFSLKTNVKRTKEGRTAAAVSSTCMRAFSQNFMTGTCMGLVELPAAVSRLEEDIIEEPSQAKAQTCETVQSESTDEMK